MITQETCSAIWSAYREIEAGEKLLADMEAVLKDPFNGGDKTAATLKDVFGRRKHLQMGIPCGENAHRLFDVNPELARSVIRSHIASKHAELFEANERARIEINSSKRTNPDCPLGM